MNHRLSALIGRGREHWRSAEIQNLARGGLSGIAITLANRALTIGSAILLARLLGSDGYGIYASAIATMMILAVVAEFGMYVLLIREVSAAHEREAWGELIGLRVDAMRFTLIVSGVVGALGCALIWLTPWISDFTERMVLTLMLGLLPLNTIARLGAAILAGFRRLAAAQIAELFLFPAISFLVFLTLFATVGPGLRPQDAMLAQILSGGAALAIIFLMIRIAYAPARAIRARGETISGFQRRALPFLIMGAAGTITQQIDTVIVSVFLTHGETAHYRVASQAATLTWFGMQILQTISAPYFARFHHRGDTRSLARLFRWTTLLATASAAPVLLIFIFFGRPLIDFTFGPEFEGAQPMMVVLSIGYLVNVMCGPVGSLLAMTGEERWASRAFIIMSATSVTISLVFVTLVGPLGVAFGTAFGFAGYHLVLRYRTWRRLGF